jgi:hypothetical protein
MLYVLALNILAIALAALVGFGLVSSARVGSMLEWLHAIIGITPPTTERVRAIAIVWIGLTIALMDGLLVMLVYLTTRLMSH